MFSEMQKQLFKLFCDFNEFCKENNIEFVSAYGTVLGAVRHQGFIPWDDDIDVYMTIDEYKKLLAVLEHQSVKKFRVDDWNRVKGYPYLFPKIVSTEGPRLKEQAFQNLDYIGGLYIDVFILMPVSDNRVLRMLAEKKRYCMYCIHKLFFMDTMHRKILRLPQKIITAGVNIIRFTNSYYRNATRVYGKKCVESISFGEKYVIDYEWLFPIKHESFEGIDIPVPGKSEFYLKQIYGDYLSLPPEEERISNHSFIYQ